MANQCAHIQRNIQSSLVTWKVFMTMELVARSVLTPKVLSRMGSVEHQQHQLQTNVCVSCATNKRSLSGECINHLPTRKEVCVATSFVLGLMHPMLTDHINTKHPCAVKSAVPSKGRMCFFATIQRKASRCLAISNIIREITTKNTTTTTESVLICVTFIFYIKVMPSYIL